MTAEVLFGSVRGRNSDWSKKNCCKDNSAELPAIMLAGSVDSYKFGRAFDFDHIINIAVCAKQRLRFIFHALINVKKDYIVQHHS